MNATSWCILGLSILGQVSMMVFVLRYLLHNKSMIQARLNQQQKWTTEKFAISMILPFIFPIHFVCLSTTVAKQIYCKAQNKLEDHLKHYDLTTKPQEFQRTFVQLCQSLNQSKSAYVNVTKLKEGSTRCETILETLPSSIVVISLGLLSNSYPSLRHFVNTNDWLKGLGLSFKDLLVIMSLNIALSCINAALKIRYVCLHKKYFDLCITI